MRENRERREEAAGEIDPEETIREIEKLTAEMDQILGVKSSGVKQGDEIKNSRELQEIKTLLGVNYVGPEILGKHLYGDEDKWSFPAMDLSKLKEILHEADEWEVGKKKYETYALTFVPPVSFLELRAKANDAAEKALKTPAFYEEKYWNEGQPFVTNVPREGRWELVRSETVPGSTYKHYAQQIRLLVPHNNLTATTFEALASMMVGQYLESDIRIYKGQAKRGRTSTTSKSGDALCLGELLDDGAFMDDSDETDADTGLSVSRNLKSVLGS